MSAPSTSEIAASLDIIVLNGTSSSGKTSLAAALQDVLDGSWLVFGTDTLISALPLALVDIHHAATIGARPRENDVREGGISFDADGEITIGPEYRRLEASWLSGLAAIAASGTRLILDEVFLDGERSQERFRQSFPGRRIAWIGVTCDRDVAAERERRRGDRVVGMVEQQSLLVHEGVLYDLVVDTTVHTAPELAQRIAHNLRDAIS
jgi:chloramphenicol 3-O phosphotransferase